MSFISLQRTPLSEAAPLDATTFAAICLTTCKRLPAMRRTAGAQRLDRLVTAGAWTDAALALIAIELPSWQLHRLVYDDSEWHCMLSNNRGVPEWLDDTVDAHHPDMARALLGAFVEAMRRGRPFHLAARPTAPEQSQVFDAMLCDNFA
jgi:hypothetical protein